MENDDFASQSLDPSGSHRLAKKDDIKIMELKVNYEKNDIFQIKIEKIIIPIIHFKNVVKEKEDIKMDIRYHFFSSIFSI